jgi:hypothetical protein
MFRLGAERAIHGWSRMQPVIACDSNPPRQAPRSVFGPSVGVRPAASCKQFKTNAGSGAVRAQ